MGEYSIDNVTAVQGRYAGVVSPPQFTERQGKFPSEPGKVLPEDTKIENVQNATNENGFLKLSDEAKNEEKSHFGSDDKKGKYEGIVDNEKEMSAITEILNKFVAQWNAHLQFTLHKETSIMSIKFVDLKNNKVLKEFPPEDYLDMIANIRKYIGAFVDKKV